MNDNLSQKEVNYTELQIKKFTPYLDHVEQPSQTGGTKPLTSRHRAFSWYYVFNGNNKSGAYKFSKFGKYNEETNKIDIIIPEKRNYSTDFSTICGVEAGVLFKKPYIQECIALIQTEHCKNLKQNLHQTFTEQLVIQSTYDPSMFIDVEGKPVIKTWDEIPEKFRCCIESIETKYFGKDADRKVISIKLVDRAKARNELYKFIDTMKMQNQKVELIHKTIDNEGNEVGIDIKKASDEELQRMLENLNGV